MILPIKKENARIHQFGFLLNQTMRAFGIISASPPSPPKESLFLKKPKP
jgi:hypothetical protein